MRNGLLIDYEFCTGSQSCEIACKQEHGFSVGTWGIRVLDEGPWEIDEKTVNWNKIPTPTAQSARQEENCRPAYTTTSPAS